MAFLSMKVDGIKPLLKKLKSFPAKIEKKILRQALRAGGKIFQQQAKANAPVKSGLTKRSLKVRSMKRSRTRVGIRVATSAKDYTGDTFYASFVEYGHKLGRRPGRGSKNKDTRRTIEGKHFIRSAYESKKDQALNVIKQQLRIGIAEENSK